MASWAPPIGDERRRSPLAALLRQREMTRGVSPASQLAPQHAPQGVVGMPHALPPQLAYGPTERGIAQSGQMGGGVTQHPYSLTAGPPEFVQPNFGSGPAGVAQMGGAAQSPLFSGGRSLLAALLGTGSSGGTTTATGSTSPILNTALKQQVAAQTGYVAPSSTPYGSGFSPTAPTYQGGGYTAPAPTYSGSTPAGLAPRPTLSSALSTAALSGSKLRYPV